MLALGFSAIDGLITEGGHLEVKTGRRLRKTFPLPLLRAWNKASVNQRGLLIAELFAHWGAIVRSDKREVGTGANIIMTRAAEIAEEAFAKAAGGCTTESREVH